MKTFSLSPEELHKVKEILRHPDTPESYRRALVLHKLHLRKQVGDIAEDLAVSRGDIYYLIDKFSGSDKIDNFLMRQSGSGRPTLWNHHLIKGLQAALSKEPEDFGYFSRGWTVGLLKDHMSRKHGVEFSETSIRRKLHELDYVNKRPRYCLNPDPARYKKK